MKREECEGLCEKLLKRMCEQIICYKTISKGAKSSSNCTNNRLKISAYLHILLHLRRKFAKTLAIFSILLYNLNNGNV
ncbi:MAG: hypothetical protein LUI06_03195 [Ruminococcus sp.]|nr:hypothetical protein [Ruminococcus sp.]